MIDDSECIMSTGNEKIEILVCFLMDISTNCGWITLIQGMLGDNYESDVIKFNMKWTSASFS